MKNLIWPQLELEGSTQPKENINKRKGIGNWNVKKKKIENSRNLLLEHSLANISDLYLKLKYYCLDDCGFVVEPEVRQVDSSSSILLS